MPNTEDLGPYRSCVRVDVATEILGILLDLPFGAPPVCASTRTTVSAVRIGEYAIATLPGEPVTLLVDRVRALSPFPPERTIVIGYAQGHVGYLLTAEDWLQGGYEPSINSWGPLEGEYIAERVAKLLEVVATDEREDAAAGGVDRIASPDPVDAEVPAPDPQPLAGTVPDPLFSGLYVRNRLILDGAQPAPTIPRVAGVARFVWIGEDPLAGTPRVTLQRETTPGTFEDVRRRSGRSVEDGDLLLYWTPEPHYRAPGETRTHHWVAEWQAVAWDGELEDHAGAPQGRYRLYVVGTGYSLASDPFDVVAGPVRVTASVAGDSVTIGARYEAPEGWRLLDWEGSSNESVVVRRGPIRVELEYGDGSSELFTDVALSAPGQASVTAAAGATVTRVRVWDRFDNTGSAVP
jgi:neutral ceramidase